MSGVRRGMGGPNGKPRLRVTGTSYLLPGNPAWKQLGQRFTLDFGEYGDWAQSLLADGDGGPLVWLLLLDDVVSPAVLDELIDDDGRKIDDALRLFLRAIDGRLAVRPADELVVAWSVPSPGSAIETAKRRWVWSRLASRLEEHLYERARRHPALYLLPLDLSFARHGTDACFDSRNYYAARCRFSAIGLRVLAAEIEQILDRIRTPARKVLVLDCDQTLWGGTVGEDGLEGLQLGQDGSGRAFHDFQTEVKSLTRRGVLLALASKNNEADVWRVFDGHSAMVLTRSDISGFRIDWREKSDNIAAIADELGLGLDSLVFWDDNPLEREKVRRRLPQVLTPDIPPNVDAWPSFLKRLPAFAGFGTTEEDRDKSSQYRSRRLFEDERKKRTDETDFLESIALTPSMVSIDAGTVGRAEQLCAKTNQFNLRTVRHGAAEIMALASHPRNVAFLVHLEDRFGDHGNVVLVICRTTDDPQVAFLDTFLVSCRALGRRIESWALASCVRGLRARGYRWLLAEYRATERNRVAADFLPGHGFFRLDGIRGAEAARRAARNTKPDPEATRYLADLDSIIIPHQDLFTRATTDTPEFAQAAVS